MQRERAKVLFKRQSPTWTPATAQREIEDSARRIAFRRLTRRNRTWQCASDCEQQRQHPYSERLHIPESISNFCHERTSFKGQFVVGAAATDVQSGMTTMCYLPVQSMPSTSAVTSIWAESTAISSRPAQWYEPHRDCPSRLVTAEQDDPAACIGAIDRDIDTGGHALSFRAPSCARGRFSFTPILHVASG